jgi:divalent metal cation (Fe/Co/Zn/Cd) transporter
VIPHVAGKSELGDNDPEQISQLLELQLAQKRAEWKRAAGHYRMLRSLSFLFLFLVIAAGLFAFFLAFSRINEERPNYHSTKPSSISG